MQRLTTSVALILLFALASPASAQLASGDLERVRTALLHQVRLTTDGGERTTGVLQSADNETLTLLTREGTVAAQAGTVRRVERHGDSLKDGFIVGALVGVAYSSVMVAVFEGESKTPAAGIAVATLMTGLIGAGIDALHQGWTTVYKRPAVK